MKRTWDIERVKTPFCSYTCRYAHGRQTLVCTHCQKSFSRKKADIRAELPFCSRTCYRTHDRISISPIWTIDDPITLGYIAGIIDGEGCIHISHCANLKKTPSPLLQVSVGNTNEALIHFLKNTFPFHSYISHTPNNKPHQRAWKPASSFVVQHRFAISFLLPLLPALIIKKPQALLAIRYQSLGSQERQWVKQGEQFYLAMQQLNKRGTTGQLQLI